MLKGGQHEKKRALERRAAMLPPGIEQLSQVIYGELEVSIKRLNYLNVLYKEGNVRVRFSFFGETGASHILVPQNASHELLQHFHTNMTFSVGCSIWQFADYLADMKIFKLAIVDHLNQVMGFADIQLEEFLSTQLTEKSESVFKDLKGTFSIIGSEKQQKIGSIDIEIKNWFDPEISWIVKQAEEKYHMGQLSSPIDEYVTDQVLGKSRRIFRRVASPRGKNEEQSVFGQMLEATGRSRIPYSLEENDGNYTPMMYTLDKLRSAEEEAEEKQKIFDQQRLIFRQQLEREKQEAKDREEKEKEEQQRDKEKKRIRDEEALKPQDKLHLSQSRRGNSNGKITSMNDTKGSQNNSIQKGNKIDENKSKYQNTNNQNQYGGESNVSQNQMKELEKVNRTVVLKMDRLVGVGEELLGEYLRQKELDQEEKIKKDEEKKNKLKQLNIIASNTERLSKELAEQRAINEKLQNTIVANKKQPDSTAPNQKTATLGGTLASNMPQNIPKLVLPNKEFPVSRTLFDKNVMRVKIYAFTCTDNNFWNKVKYKNLYIENDIPSLLKFQAQGAEPTDKLQFKAVCKNTVENEFAFNQDFSYNLDIKPDIVSKILREKITFKLKTFNLPKNALEIDKDANFVLQLAEGGITMGEFMARSKNFSGLFHLEMKTKLSSPSVPPKPEKKGDPKGTIIKVNKENLKPVEQNEEIHVGILKASVQLLKYEELDPRREFQQHQATAAFLQATSGAIQLFAAKPSVSLQMLLQIGQLKVGTKNTDRYTNKQFYCSYKVYGTSETIVTKPITYFYGSGKSFNNQMIMSTQKDIIIKMKKVPFIIEVWEKKEDENIDILLGIINISLTPISESVLTKADNFNQIWCGDTSSKQLIILSDSMQEFKPISSDNKVGSVQIDLVFGSALQISNFINNNNKIKEESPHIQQSPQIPDLQQILDYPQAQSEAKSDFDSNAEFDKAIKKLKENKTKRLKDRKFEDDEDARLEAQERKRFESERRMRMGDRKKIEGDAKDMNQDLQFNKYKYQEGAYLDSDVFIEVFEELRNKQKKVAGRIREFLHSLRPPSFFVKSSELFEFFVDLPIAWRNNAILISFSRAFDIGNLGYYRSGLFMKSYSAYLLLEATLRNKFSSLIITLKDVLAANRMSISEFERTLNSIAEFGFINKDKLLEELLRLSLAGLDNEFLQKISSFLLPEAFEGVNTEKLVSTGLLIEYIKQVESYSCVKMFYRQDEQWYRNAVVESLKDKIASQHIQVALLADQKTQGIVEVNTFKLLEVLESAEIDYSFWEAYLLLKEIVVFCGGDADKLPSKLFVNVLELNNYLRELERTVQLEKPIEKVMDNESDLRDLNQILNGVRREGDELPGIKDGYISYWFGLRVDQLNEMKTDRSINKVVEVIDPDLNHLVPDDPFQSPSKLKEIDGLDGMVASLRYKLPLDDEKWVESGAFQLGGKTIFKVCLSGSHSIVVPKGEDLAHLFKDTKVDMQLRILEEEALIIGEAHLEITHLLGLAQSDTDYAKRNTYVRIETQKGELIGYVNVQLEFRRQNLKVLDEAFGNQEQVLQKNERKIQKLLPKQGYLLITIQAEGLDSLEGECHKIECSVFKDDSYLSHLFKPFESLLPLINHETFISMSTQVVAYFQESPSCFSIYDSENNLIAQHEFNLLDVLLEGKMEEKVTLLNTSTNTSFTLDINISYNKNSVEKQ